MPRDSRREADELRRLRKGFGKTQEQMARLLDVSHRTYAGWEGGQECQFGALEAMRCWAHEAEALKGKRKAR